jgi:flagellar biosynthesis protein FlhA
MAVLTRQKAIKPIATSQSVAVEQDNWIDTRLASRSNIIFAAGLVTVLATLLIPLPTPLMDMLLAVSISLAVAILFITLAAREPLELSTFPSLLLFVTLFRLSLNVASTRLILLQANAGEIIRTFGNFVAGGNLVVGMVIFLILVIIQFVVVTKGAGRISEVAARFVLDAMPGKQMAVDADLNAGVITDEQARQRREKIVRESEFYGAMDGASKFIRGDAVAGLVITAVNLVGGILVGYGRGMAIGQALRTYCILSVGDGLVSQIPSMVVAVSSGFLVSKTSSRHSVSYDLTKQLLRSGSPLTIASVIMVLAALVPGFPKLPFLALAVGTGALGWQITKSERRPEKKPLASAAEQAIKAPVEELLDVDRISVLVGVRLISMVDPRKKSTVFDRIGALRRRFAQQMGIIVPLIRLRDNINLEPTAYQIRLFDHIVAEGRIEPDLLLAMDSGAGRKAKLEGIAATEPVYGLPALWISPDKKEMAELNGYTVIDPESVLLTHLSETLQRHAHELLTREDVQALVDRLRQTQPSLVGEVVGELVPVGLLQRVLQRLLSDQIPVRDLTHILEALGEYAGRTKNQVILTELVRKALSRTITEKYKNEQNKIVAITLEPSLEHRMVTSVRQEPEQVSLQLEPQMVMALTRGICEAYKSTVQKGFDNAVLLCDSRLRSPLAEILERIVPRVAVVAYDEILTATEIEPVETVSLGESNAALSAEPVAAGLAGAGR